MRMEYQFGDCDDELKWESLITLCVFRLNALGQVFYHFDGGIMPDSASISVDSVDSSGLQPQFQSLVIRKDFPETWILDMINFNDDRFVLSRFACSMLSRDSICTITMDWV